jgi:hypothetical protein
MPRTLWFYIFFCLMGVVVFLTARWLSPYGLAVNFAFSIVAAYLTIVIGRRVIGLKWNQVDLAAKSVRIEGAATKNKKARTIALDGELLEAIQGQWEKRKVRKFQANPLLCFVLTSSTATGSR